jgi:NAD(P)H-dependent FMN reductase
MQSLPLWSPDKKNGKGVWGQTWGSISDKLNQSDGFILVVPEYGGMATPAAKNFFYYVVMENSLINLD